MNKNRLYIRLTAIVYLIAIPSYLFCFAHVCMGGHMQHGPYPAKEWLNDLGWIVSFAAVILLSLQIKAKYRRLFTWSPLLLTLLRLGLGNGIILERPLLIVTAIFAILYLIFPHRVEWKSEIPVITGAKPKTRIIDYIVAVIFVLTMVSFISQISYRSYKILPKDKNIEGVSFPAGSEVMYSGKRVGRAYLSKAQVIDGIEWPANTELAFDETTGNVKYAKPPQPMEVCGMSVKDIAFYKPGKLFWFTLSEPKRIEDIDMPAGADVKLYESGKIFTLKLPQPQTIQGIISSWFCFHEEGGLSKTELSEPCKIGGETWPKGTTITFYKSGKIESVDIGYRSDDDEDKRLGYTIAGFYESGKIEYVKKYPYEVRVVNGIEYPKYSVFYYDESGELDGVGIGEDKNYGGINWPRHTIIHFFGNGKVSKVQLIEPVTIQKITLNVNWPDHTIICFYESGKIKLLRLGAPNTVLGKKYIKDDILTFDENGKIIRVETLGEYLKRGGK
ncbi:MAG: hypothetical protein V1927_05850 [Candidatus Omnitrophota bacterium]